MKAFKPIQLKQIIIITILVVISQIFTLLSKAQNSENELTKLFQGANYFIFLPYILSFPKLFYIKTNRTNIYFLLFYSIIVLIYGILLNIRSFAFMGLAAVIILYFFSILYNYSRIKITKVILVKSIILVTLFFFLVKPATKLSISFVLARDVNRSNVSLIETLNETFLKYNEMEDPDVIIDEIISFEQINNPWDEYYVKNPFLARLCNLKFADNIFFVSKIFNESDKDNYKKLESDKIMGLLPLPLIRLLGLNVDKEEANSGSSGDFIYFLSSSNPNAIGNYRTGSLIGSLFILFGWLYPVVLGLISFFIFIFSDSFVRIYHTSTNSTIKISPIIFVILFPLMFCFTSASNGSESFSGLFLLFRMIIEKSLIYLIFFYVSRFLSFSFFG